MKQKRMTKRGKELRDRNPGLFSTRSGSDQRHFRNEVHKQDDSYSRSQKRREERRAKYGDWDD